MKQKKYNDWDLNKGDKLRTEDGEIIEFLGMDGMYAKWLLPSGDVGIGLFLSLLKGDDGIYYPDQE